MNYTLKQAAVATGKSKPTILRAIQSGKLSASRHEVTNGWMIDPAELHRVYPPISKASKADSTTDTQRYAIPDGTGMLQRELELRDEQLEALRVERERERRALQETIADLRDRLDKETEERRTTQAKLTALLTDQRERPPAVAEKRKRNFFSWFRRG